MPRKFSSPRKKKSNKLYQSEGRKDAGYAECLHCGKEFRKRGLGTHQIACLAKAQEKLEWDQQSEKDAAHSDLEDNLNAAHNDLPFDDSNPNDDDHGAEHNDAEFPGSPMDLFDEAHGRSMIINSDSDSLDDSDRPDKTKSRTQTPDSEINELNPDPLPDVLSAFVQAPDEAEPQPDEIRVEYHPTSQKSAVHLSLDDYLDAADLGNVDGDTAHAKSSNETPWHPFSSRLDFEIADLVLDTHMNSTQANGLISLIQRCIDNPGDFSLISHDHILDIWKAARSKTSSFVQKTMSIPYPKKTSHTTVEFDVWTRPLWDWCDDLVSKPDVVSKFRWNAERVFKYNDSKKIFERCIDEPWTADAWWDVQSRLPDGALPLCIILYADKTQLSSFGTAKGYPVLARCANLPVGLRNGKGLAGGRLVGWLPIVKEDAKETKKKRFVNLKRIVWHEGFRQLLESIVEYTKTGKWKKCGDGILRWLFPIILMLSADYEEQCVMALIRGLNSACPCPICLVPNEKLSNLSKKWPPRTTQHMQEIYQNAQSLSAEGKEDVLKTYGLRDVENIFWSLKFTDVYFSLNF
ncbi:hypothetical protein HYPSUDRAFT_50110, partial [Hypholoma sublateritium FD-334 SS-4]